MDYALSSIAYDLHRKMELDKRASRLRKARNNLWFLCTEILGYDKLTEEFHKPMLDDIDRQRRDGVRNSLELWPRGHYKTTIRIGQIIQDILHDPECTILVCHAVDDEVQKIVEETGMHFLKCKELRLLKKEIMPSATAKRWLRSNQFTVGRKSYSRQPTLLGKSTGSEITGAHVDRVYLDDIIGRNTIENSELPKVKSWYRNTVIPVLNPGGTVRATGTRWDIDDIYGDWIKSKGWETRTRAAYETDGVPDYKGKPVLFSVKELRNRREIMGPSDFAMQMMNDPSPAEDKPWDRVTCEHFISKREAAGPGLMVVLSDPAPARAGSFSGVGEKLRQDGSKDFWTHAVCKIRRKGIRQEIILYDGDASKDWTTDEGFTRLAELQRHYGATHQAIEATGSLGPLLDEALKRIVRKSAIPYNSIKLKNTWKGKNAQFAILASRAKEYEFLICKDTCDAQFLELFLEQARGWRPMPNGKNALKYDDHANVVCFAVDPGVLEVAPMGEEPAGEEFVDEWDDDDYSSRSRYCCV